MPFLLFRQVNISYYQHRIPETEKAVLLQNSRFIGFKHLFPSCEGGDQHKEGGLRQVEICDETVHYLEPVSGVDKDIRLLPFYRANPSLFIGKGFNSTAAGGAYADHPAAFSLGLIYKLCIFGSDETGLAVHMVIGDLLFLYGSESPEAHVERDIGRFYSPFPYPG